MRQLIEKYHWADDDPDLVLTAAAIRGRTADEVIRIYGGDPDAMELRTFNDAWPPADDFGKYFYVQVQAIGQLVVALEPNGWTGEVPEIARRASASEGYFFSAYWSMTGVYRLAEAKDGKVTAHFDPLMVGYPGGMGDLQPDWVEHIEFDTDHPNASCLAALEEQTGVAFDQAWLNDPLPTYRIPDPDEMLRGVENARVP